VVDWWVTVCESFKAKMQSGGDGGLCDGESRLVWSVAVCESLKKQKCCRRREPLIFKLNPKHTRVVLHGTVFLAQDQGVDGVGAVVAEVAEVSAAQHKPCKSSCVVSVCLAPLHPVRRKLLIELLNL
jgi:hypothetical protein